MRRNQFEHTTLFPASFADDSGDWQTTRRQRRKKKQKGAKNQQQSPPKQQKKNEPATKPPKEVKPVQRKRAVKNGHKPVDPQNAFIVEFAQKRNQPEEKVRAALAALELEMGPISNPETLQEDILKKIHALRLEELKGQMSVDDFEEEEQPPPAAEPIASASDEPVVDTQEDPALVEEETKSTSPPVGEPEMSQLTTRQELEVYLKQQLRQFDFGNSDTHDILQDWISKIGSSSGKEFCTAFTNDGGLDKLVEKIITAELTTSKPKPLEEYSDEVVSLLEKFLHVSPQDCQLIFTSLADIAHEVKLGSINLHNEHLKHMTEIGENGLQLLLRKPETEEDAIPENPFNPPSDYLFTPFDEKQRIKLRTKLDELDRYALMCHKKLNIIQHQDSQMDLTKPAWKLVHDALQRIETNLNKYSKDVMARLNNDAKKNEKYKEQKQNLHDAGKAKEEELQRKQDENTRDQLFVSQEIKKKKEELKQLESELEQLKMQEASIDDDRKVWETANQSKLSNIGRKLDEIQTATQRWMTLKDCYLRITTIVQIVRSANNSHSQSEELLRSASTRLPFMDDTKMYIGKLREVQRILNENFQYCTSILGVQKPRESNLLPDDLEQPINSVMSTRDQFNEVMKNINEEIALHEGQLRKMGDEYHLQSSSMYNSGDINRPMSAPFYSSYPTPQSTQWSSPLQHTDLHTDFNSSFITLEMERGPYGSAAHMEPPAHYKEEQFQEEPTLEMAAFQENLNQPMQTSQMSSFEVELQETPMNEEPDPPVAMPAPTPPQVPAAPVAQPPPVQEEEVKPRAQKAPLQRKRRRNQQQGRPVQASKPPVKVKAPRAVDKTSSWLKVSQQTGESAGYKLKQGPSISKKPPKTNGGSRRGNGRGRRRSPRRSRRG